MGDSSDDELPVAPMKLSAEAKALLGDDVSVMDGTPVSQKQNDLKNVVGARSQRGDRKPSPMYHFNSSVRERTASPTASRSGSPRIVRLNSNGTAPSTLRKASPLQDGLGSPGANIRHDLITPAPRPRIHYRTSPGTGSTTPNGHGKNTDVRDSTQPASGEYHEVQDAAAQMENLSMSRSKRDDMGSQTAQRRGGNSRFTGRLLSGPARRGLKRRQSEDDSPMQEPHLAANPLLSPEADRHAKPQESQEPRSIGHEAQAGSATHLAAANVERPPHVRFQSQASIITGSPESKKQALPRTALADATSDKENMGSALKSSERRTQPVFKMPPLPPLPSRFDQENEPPPTFKRNKAGLSLTDVQDKLGIMPDKMTIPAPVTASPKRPALAPRSQNTPLRPAPPPPKMTVLDTVTATAGAASASQAKKKRNQYMSVNGRYFTRMDCIGRGGSSKVYRVMAENYKVFALKRVALEDQDEMAIRGYKGEIDLLQKLENVDRVVRLFDYEINEEKHTLSVLMEMGESDLNRVLTHRLNAEDAKLDITFTRYFWKEMLESVQAVHGYDIVHSDLKPANFLLLQGRLKLIDFGISNAIADDTVNVHREQHIGTPNYMSPEALIDANAAAGLPSTQGKMMKLGKPSDVWSLGCILYQMTYGKPPFAHIANQMQRIMAIPNPRHTIAFPETGVGGVLLPVGLIRTLKRCLNRDPTQRPTVDELLAFGDPFLFPDVLPARDTVPVSQELIARLQNNIIKHVREKGLPTDVELSTWPARFFASIKAAVEEGRA